MEMKIIDEQLEDKQQIVRTYYFNNAYLKLLVLVKSCCQPLNSTAKTILSMVVYNIYLMPFSMRNR